MGKLRHGGEPDRRGRKPGSKNRRTILLGAKLDKLIPDAKLLKLLWTLAEGESRDVLAKSGEVVTVKDRGDGHVATYLADRKWGKIPQPLAGDPVNPVAVRILSDDRLGVKP